VIERAEVEIAHGGLVHDELAAAGLSPNDILDVSVNVNPFGPAPIVRRAIAAAPIDRYPDPHASEARRALGAWMGAPASRVAIGSGAVDLMWALARAVLREGDVVAILEPAFSEMRSAALRSGARIAELRARPEDDFAFDPRAFARLLRETTPRLAYLAAPSNPAGRWAPLDRIAELAEEHPRTVFVVDVSFASMSARHDDTALYASSRVVWLRSLTKDHALPGLRVGCALAGEELVRAIDRERPPWSVSGLAQAAAIAVTSDEATRFVAECRARLLEDRARLHEALLGLGLRVHPSETIFALVDLGSRVRAADLRRALLLEHRVLVRDATSFGLPHHIRIAARPEPDRARVIAALERELRA
jgi:histidinol-phosphate/aromatic aminotransferase/cobyric acid decarboxylase-like protein